MCNRVIQNDVEIKPGGKMTVLLRGPGGEFDLPFDEAVFGGPARVESRKYWIHREGAEEVDRAECHALWGEKQIHPHARL